MAGVDVLKLDTQSPTFSLVVPRDVDLFPVQLTALQYVYDADLDQIITSLDYDALNAGNVTLVCSAEYDFHQISATLFRTSDGLVGVQDIGTPADGMTHTLAMDFYLSHPLNPSKYQTGIRQTYIRPLPKIEPLPAPTATLIRQRTDNLSDQVQLDFTGGKLAKVFYVAGVKTGVLAIVDSTDTSMVIENTARYLPRGDNPVQVRYGLKPYQAKSTDGILWSDPVSILPNPVVDSIPVDNVPYSSLVEQVTTETGESAVFVDAIMHAAFNLIKSVVAKGGSVELEYFGIFKAVWKEDTRLAKFDFHKAFSLGTQQGQVLP